MYATSFTFAGLVAIAAAQSTVLLFTSVPSTVTDGHAAAIEYSTNDTTTPVTILLREGLSTNLRTIGTILDSGTPNGTYIWTPNATLPDGTDYALQISQGSETNYFGPFKVQGAVASSSSSSSSGAAMSTTARNASMSSVGTMSAGTGSALPRNTTMSMATLNTPSSSGPASNSAAATSGAGSQGTSTAAASSASKTGGASTDLIAPAGSILALVFGALAAVL